MWHEVAVIGDGAAGTLVCAHLLRSTRRARFRIQWIGSGGAFGPGLAYSTREPSHLLNIPAGGMSAFPDDPGHFLRWLERQHPELDPRADHFVSRMHYGEYLSELVPENSPLIERRADPALDIQDIGGRYRISLKSGAALIADEVVLALGALSSLPGQSAYGALRPSQLDEIPADARVLLIGTGLTMIDALLSLRARAHSGAIFAVSRHGLLPRVHANPPGFEPHSPSDAFRALLETPITRLSRALRIFRSECLAADAAGPGWRAVFDAIRPSTAALWQGLTARQKRRFYRHLRPYWDVHRHRIAPAIQGQLQDLLDQGHLRFEAGRILRVEKTDGPAGRPAFEVLMQPRLQPRAKAETHAERFDALIDCTGFASEITAVNDPLLHAVIDRGLVELGDPPFGISPRLSTHPGVHVIGPLLRASIWESVAIPEIRAQAAVTYRRRALSWPHPGKSRPRKTRPTGAE